MSRRGRTVRQRTLPREELTGTAERTERLAGRRGRVWRVPRKIRVGVACLLVLGLVLLVGWYVYAFSDDPFDSRSDISCSKAMSFAHGTLPETTSEEECRRDAWTDTYVTGTFRMPRADVREWLEASYPGVEPSETCDEDLCLRRSYDAAKTEGARQVRLTVAHEGAYFARVSLDAFAG